MDATNGAVTVLADETSQEYIGRWHTLVSTTNWEKGRIICQWRAALIEAGAPAGEYSDDAWSRRLGTVSAQHAGRLRRTFVQFGETHQAYPGLYWSHFQAAVDWDGAEMWLEGAVQNNWSVSEMRRERWQTLGAIAEDQPRDEQIVSEEYDSDAPPNEPAQEIPRTISPTHGIIAESDEALEGELGDAGEFADADDYDRPQSNEGGDRQVETVRPFARLADLPADIADAFESFKLAILRHKLSNWSDVPRDDVLSALDALKELAVAPS